MTSARPTTRPRGAGPALRRLLAVALLLLVAGGVTAAYRSIQQAQAAERDAYAANRTVAPPIGFGAKGIRLAQGSGGELMLMTDLTCPSCQASAADNAAALRAAAARGDRDVWLDVLHVRQASTTNRTALAVLVRIVAAAPGQGLDSYLAISSAVRGVPDGAPTDEVLRRIAAALPADLREHARPGVALTSAELAFLDARTHENRQHPGHVPALLLDGREVSLAELGGGRSGTTPATDPTLAPCSSTPDANSCVLPQS